MAILAEVLFIMPQVELAIFSVFIQPPVLSLIAGSGKYADDAKVQRVLKR